MKAATQKAKKKLSFTTPKTGIKRKRSAKSKVKTQSKREYDEIQKRLQKVVKAAKNSNGARRLYNTNGNLFAANISRENDINRLNAVHKELVPKKLFVSINRLDPETIAMLTQMV